MDSSNIKPDTSVFSKWSHLDSKLWKRFVNGNTKSLEYLALYVPEDEKEEFDNSFKEYMLRLNKYGNPYSVWKSGEKARALRTSGES
jgi:hypothetical protein